MVYIFSIPLYYGVEVVAVNANSIANAMCLINLALNLEIEVKSDYLVAIAPEMRLADGTRVLPNDCYTLGKYQE